MPPFDPYWTQALRALLPWATSLFTAISALGTDYFYVALIATAYWTTDKRSSTRAALLLLTSSVTNYWLKITIRNPRPPPHQLAPRDPRIQLQPPQRPRPELGYHLRMARPILCTPLRNLPAPGDSIRPERDRRTVPLAPDIY